jgi:hypothetical protein
MTARKRRALGRPTEIHNRVRLDVYMTRAERKAINSAARAAHVSASAWVRAAALAALPSSHQETT